MAPPSALSSDINGSCPHVAFKDYDWHDVSCNFNGYGYHMPWNATVFCLYAAASAVAFQLSIQLIGRTLLRFKRRNTLYFWSLIIVAVGILCYIWAFICRMFIFPISSPAFPVPYTLAQIFILTGFGLVMYSRLHLITNDRWTLRGLLIMIIAIAVLGHTMTFVQLAVISLKLESLSRKIYHAIAWLDVIFTIQDVTLSGAYIYLFWRRMQVSSEFTNDRAQRRDMATFKLLIAAAAIVLILDIIQNVLLCLKIYIARSMWFPLICALKLETEFFVLNRLVKAAERASNSLQNGSLRLGMSVLSTKHDEAAPGASPEAVAEIVEEVRQVESCHGSSEVTLQDEESTIRTR